MQLKQSLIIAIILGIISVAAWELYWRSQGLHPTLNDEKALWAMARANVEKAGKDDVVILGSSRAYFDIQVKQWEKLTGKVPIQLSSTGSSPLPTFHDIVNNTNFNGTVIVGVTPGLLFSTTYPKAFPWERPQSKVDFYRDRTYAQRLNYLLSVPLQQNLVLMSADEEEWNDDIDLKALLKRVNWGTRDTMPPPPPFYNFGDVSIPRNISMMPRTVTDTAFAKSIIDVWHFFGKGSPPPDKDATTEFFMKDVKKFKAKGGNLILVRPPSSGGVRMGEKMGLPRERFWDSLVKVANVKSYHFEDYDQLKDLVCPEESHLSLDDANFFTREFIEILRKDNAIPNLKSN
ncbi:hypothetical protein L3X39_14185 [Sabulilitoribacter multivorans]|uniref:SGNH/GDSL hydrolase family protein n=1 Tax=Flaviramulus multivorans TaxID=1304750 RepID=A0ABS9IMG1_9FLAO|nr:hypothetical protein [Flaviramulus multivorans]MCF7561791.1 hypothetical protein [Flaviramulus multivorans]